MPIDRPNVIWIFGDEHRGQALSAAGDPNINTPNIDSLIEQGVWFHHARAGNPWCAPFRGSLLTGRYPHNCVYRTPMQMDPAYETIADRFNAAGYATAYFGKWHLDGAERPEGEKNWRPDMHFVPKERRGRFETWVGYENGSYTTGKHVHGHTAHGGTVDFEPLDGYETDALTDRLIDYLSHQAGGLDPAPGRPFFASLSVVPPHPPYIGPEPWLSKYSPDNIQLRPNVPHLDWMQEGARETLCHYYAMVENLDHNVGRITAALEETGLKDSTVIMFFSDHGDMLWSHGHNGKSVPWEESLRIPFVISGAVPDAVRGRQVDALLNTVDIAPTTLGLCGIDQSDQMPGFDYSPYVRAANAGSPLTDEPDSIYCQHNVRKRHAYGMDCTWRAVVMNDGWKIACTEGAWLGMFNLNNDPYEQHNLVYDHASRDQRARLRQRLCRWIEEVDDSYSVPSAD